MGNDSEDYCQSLVFLFFHEMEFTGQHTAKWPSPTGAICKVSVLSSNLQKRDMSFQASVVQHFNQITVFKK